jgi:hypothetical protein
VIHFKELFTRYITMIISCILMMAQDCTHHFYCLWFFNKLHIHLLIEQSFCISAYDIYLPSSYLLPSDILGFNLTFWCRNFFLNFSTPCI